MLDSNGDWYTGTFIPKLLPLWTPTRFNGIEGGRGSGKSHTVADIFVGAAVTSHVRAACMREIQNSIKDSSKQLLEDKINEHGVAHKFKITDKEIVCPSTDSLFVFRGLQNHTAATIKSLEGFTHAWYEEAHTLSQTSIETATPTFRSNSVQFFTWNREDDDDPVDTFFREGMEDNDPDFQYIECNYPDNPYFPPELERDMLRDKRRNLDRYNHIWLGKARKNSEARVFRNVRSFAFETPVDAFFLHGADWGFSVDPTVLIRCFTGRVVNGQAVYDPEGTTLFIDYEAYEVGCEIDHTPLLFDKLNPRELQRARKWEIRADSSRPETISYMQRHNYPLLVRATKGPNSIIEGVTFLQNYDIVIHPRCTHTVDEFSFYSYKVDKKTKKITNELEEKKNHVIDSVRYAIEPLRAVAPEWYVGT